MTTIRGRLEPIPAKKTLTTWRYIPPGATDPVKIVVTLEDAGDGLILGAYSDKFSTPFRDSDIARLRATVEAHLNSTVADIQQIDWEPWLEVRVIGDRQHPTNYKKTNGFNLAITYEPLARGVHRDTGEVFGINPNGTLRPFPSPMTRPTIGRPASEIKTANDFLETAYIPDTAENRAALDEVLGGMEQLNARLSRWLSQAQIGRALAHVVAEFPLLN